MLSIAIPLSLAFVQLAAASGIVGDATIFTSKAFDYLIVGGGTAGLAVASRLSENPKHVVGVLEAGLDYPTDPLILTPANFGRTQGDPKYDWMLATVPQASLDGTVIQEPRGKVLGGSSALNYMVYDRASAPDYDAWQTFGGKDWSWASLLPYFKKTENVDKFPPPNPWNYTYPADAAYEGFGGAESDLFEHLVLEHHRSFPLGRSTCWDSNLKYACPRSVKRATGQRSYSENTYHSLAVARPNYFVLLGAEAVKINFAPSAAPAKATGVTFIHGGSTYTAHAAKEIVLSAGSFKTPQLLELSGIGDPARLTPLGISMISKVPGVGENLQDHVLVSSSWTLKPGFLTFDVLINDPVYAAAANATYYHNGTGIFSGSPTTLAFINLQTFIDTATINNLLTNAIADAAKTKPSPLEAASFAIQAGFIKAAQVGQIEIIMHPGILGPQSPSGQSHISIIAALAHPWSRGSVHINSVVGTDPPVIDPHYLENSIDMQLLVKGLQFCRKIADTEPLKSAIASPLVPPSSVATDDQIETYIKASLSPVYHPVGTAAMAPLSMGGVVNNRLVVYGTSNLRVADASIIPIHIASHTQQTVYAIGEKAADLIKQDA